VGAAVLTEIAKVLYYSDTVAYYSMRQHPLRTPSAPSLAPPLIYIMPWSSHPDSTIVNMTRHLRRTAAKLFQQRHHQHDSGA
jgi:hypothetical protein